ncbi:MAG: EAL domain-containing protein [Nitrospirae bacterium]|nr:EAL domain-containing protein [Nitrospirota bacterium]MCL5286076.1 EAL domain-containing protein [Nitrospirota bacterium]
MERSPIDRSLRILMLEDTPSDAELEEHELKKGGIPFILKRVETREAFVQALKEFDPDLVLSDYSLPGFDGMSALEILRNNYPEVPAIMVTGALSDVEAVELIHAGAKDYVLKDRLARLVPAIRHALETRESERARRKAEKALVESEAKFRGLVESTNDWIWETDERGVFTYASPQIQDILGYSPLEVLGKKPLDLTAKTGNRNRGRFETLLAERQPIRLFENILRHRNGQDVFVETSGNPVFDSQGFFRGYRGIDRDISKRKKAEGQIVHLAFYDALTDLPNRRAFKRRIQEEIDRLWRNPGRFAVGILDLDGFKEVNDRLGHPAGDDLLVQVAKRLQRALRSSDTLARLGGDEFGILLSEVEEEDAFFDRLMKILRAPFEIGGEPVVVSGSLGITFSPPDTPDADLLLAHADLALYRVKNRGRNGWAPFQTEMEETLALRHRIRTDFERALSNGELLLHYQPQVNMTTGEVTGVEALIRWNHPKRGLLLPSDFIDVVEKSELVASLGHFVLKEALDQQRRWKEGGLDLRVSVNIGARHFLSESFPEDLERAVEGHDDSHSVSLELEVTETEALKDLSQAQKVIEKCRALGIAVSLDDFGTGQASLTSLQTLSVEEIKIDQGFALKIRTSQKDRAIVSSLVVVGRMMEIDVIVEGVETEEDGRALIDMGCELAQGYGIARPMPAEAIPKWVATWKPFESWTRETYGRSGPP